MVDSNEDLPEVSVTGDAAKTTVKPPRGAWKTGLAVGAMTLNPVFGIAAGIIQKMRNKSYLETAANDKREQGDLKGMIANEMKIADPDEKRLLDWANMRRSEAYERIVAGDRALGEKILDDVHEALKGLIGGDIAARKTEQAKAFDFKRDLVKTAATSYHQEFQDTMAALNGMNRSAQQILELVSQKDFDPNKPLNKAHLAELLSTGMMALKDAPDMGDAITQGVSAINGIAGGIVGAISTGFKAKDFHLTAEDYNKLALNTQKYAKIYAQQKFDQLGSQSAALDKQGREWGVLGEDSNLHDYVTGGEKELRSPPNPYYQAPTIPDAEHEPMRGGAARPLTPTSGLVQRPSGGRGAPARPTN
jgi:hypothetical protein